MDNDTKQILDPTVLDIIRLYGQSDVDPDEDFRLEVKCKEKLNMIIRDYAITSNIVDTFLIGLKFSKHSKDHVKVLVFTVSYAISYLNLMHFWVDGEMTEKVAEFFGLVAEKEENKR